MDDKTPHAGQHGDGWVSRACRRGYHQHCPGGCECSCHVPGYDEEDTR